MKRLFAALLCLIMLISLCACASESAPSAAPEAKPAPEEPAPQLSEEPLVIDELVINAGYRFYREGDTGGYECNIELYPQSGKCWLDMGQEGFYADCAVHEDGSITITDGDREWRFSPTETGYSFSGGSPLRAYALSDTEDHIELSGGESFNNTVTWTVRAGVYSLDVSEFQPFGAAPLLSIDLTNRLCAISCFDGSVYEGSIDFELEKLVCCFEEGCVDFYAYSSEGTELNTREVFPFLIYPMAGHTGTVTFVLDESAAIGSASVSDLDGRRQLVHEYFTFSGKGRTYLNIGRNAMLDKWTLESHGDPYINAEAKLDGDGRLSFTDGENTWYFARRGSDLCFEGGSPLYAYGWSEPGVETPVDELMPGQILERSEADYVYDEVPYIVDVSLAFEEAEPVKLLIDADHRNFILIDAFGDVAEGPVEFKGSSFKLISGQSEVLGSFDGHSIVIYAHNFYSPMYIGANDELFFNPTPSADPVAEGLEFSTLYEPLPLPEGDSLLLREEYVLYSMEYGLLYDSLVSLMPGEMSCYVGGAFGGSYGSYTEENGIITLWTESGEYVLRRQGDTLIRTGGDEMFLWGNILLGTYGIDIELPMGCAFPLYARGFIRSGEYIAENELGQSSSLRLDVKNMSGTLTLLDGREFSGSIRTEMGAACLVCPEGEINFTSLDGGIRMRNLRQDVELFPEMGDVNLVFNYVE